MQTDDPAVPGPLGGRSVDLDDDRPTPPAVVAAIAFGIVALPIIAVYVITFLVHGSVHPVQPPDVGGSKDAEFVIGWLALVAFVLACAGVLLFLNRRARWPFAVTQLGILGAAIAFLVDGRAGGNGVSVLVAVTSTLAAVLAFTPQGWSHLGHEVPRPLARAFAWVPRVHAVPEDAE